MAKFGLALTGDKGRGGSFMVELCLPFNSTYTRLAGKLQRKLILAQALVPDKLAYSPVLPTVLQPLQRHEGKHVETNDLG